MSASTQDAPQPTGDPGVDRGQVVGVWLEKVARWSARLLLAVVTVVVVLWVVSVLWVGVLPVALALIVCALLSPVARWMTAHGAHRTLAAAATLLLTLVLVLGVLVFVVPDVVQQFRDLGQAALDGVRQVQTWLAGPPFEVSTEAIDDLVDGALSWLQDRGGAIASGAFSGLAAASSVLITTALVLVLTFFFLKDGHRFLPWLRTVVGRNAGRHLSEVLTRNWLVLGGFIRTQALVSAVDAVFIGLGLVVLGVPLALGLAVITFFAGFIPIVGAVTAGVLAVLVALVSNGWQIALAVIALVLLVQQLEGNVLSPLLQGKSMKVHPGLILIAVTVGGTIFGIVGAFLAVPVTACVVATARYLSEQLDLRTGERVAADTPALTEEGRLAAIGGERASAFYRGGTPGVTAPVPAMKADPDDAAEPEPQPRPAAPADDAPAAGAAPAADKDEDTETDQDPS